MYHPLFTSAAFIAVFATVFYCLDIDSLSKLAAGSFNPICMLTPPEHVWRKLLFGVSLVTLTTVLLWNIVIQSGIILKYFTELPSRQKFMFISVSIVIILLLVFMIKKFGFAGDMANFFLGRLSENVNRYILFNNVLTAVVIGMTIGCSCVLSHPISKTSNKARAVRKRVNHFSLSICSASVLLAVGVIEIHFLYSWASRLVNSPQTEAIQSLVNTMTLGAGICFSLLLIVIYLPSAIVQNKLLSKLLGDAKVEAKEQGQDDFNVDTWRTMHGLPKPAFEYIAGLAAIVMPFVTGIIPSLFS